MTADGLVGEAAAVLATWSSGGWSPPAPVASGRIVVDDGGDGRSASELVGACRARDSTLDLVVVRDGARTDAALAVVVIDAGRADAAAMAPVVQRYLADVGRVALVCNHIDVFWDWPVLLRKCRDEVDPLRLCAVFAVTSAAADEPASGIAALVDWLHDESTHDEPATIRRAGLTAAASALRTVVPDAPDVVALRRRRVVLTADRDRGRADRLAALRAGVADCRAVSASSTHARLRGLSEEAVVRADRVATRRDAAHLSAWVTAQIESCVRSATDHLGAQLDRIAAVALLGIDARPDPLGRTAGVAPSARALPGPGRVADDALVMMFGASTGLGVGRLVASQLAGVGLVGWVSTAATAVVGLAIALWVVRTRRQAALRTAMRSWVGQTCADARGRIDQLTAMALNDAESRVSAAITRHYERVARNSSRAVADVDARLREHSGRAEAAAHATALSREIVRTLTSG